MASMEDLVYRAKHGDADAFADLLEELAPIIRGRAGRFNYVLPDFDDLCQEGRFGVWQAVWEWDPSSPYPFTAVATVRIWHRMLDAVKESRSVRKGGRWAAYSLNAPLSMDGDSGTLEEVIPNADMDQLARMIVGAELAALVQQIRDANLSVQERTVLILRALGYRQVEIAADLGMTTGGVQSALTRAGRKLGIAPMDRRRNDDEIAALYRAGSTSKEIAAQFGCDGNTVLRICRSRGIPIRKRGANGSRSLFRTRVGSI